MSKLDEWIAEQWNLVEITGLKRSFPNLVEAIDEYRASRQWVDGPPPEGCDAAYVETSEGVFIAERGKTYINEWFRTLFSSGIDSRKILRHCPLPEHPPLPKPKIPEEVAKHGDGLYKVGNNIASVTGEHVAFYRFLSGCRLTDVAKDLTWKRMEQGKAGDA